MRKWLQDIRFSKGLTHQEVADKCGIKRSYYTMIENGTRKPSVKVAKKIAVALDFDWTLFFDSESNEMKLKMA